MQKAVISLYNYCYKNFEKKSRWLQWSDMVGIRDFRYPRIIIIIKVFIAALG